MKKLGAESFRRDYAVRESYASGAMAKGIASPQLVIRMARAGFLSFYGTGGRKLDSVESAIQQIQAELNPNQPYGMNLLCNLAKPAMEMDMVMLYLRYGITNIEASAYVQITPALVKFRLTHISQDSQGKINVPHKIIAKISRPEIARLFLSPAPERIVQKLLADGQITEQEAALSKRIPLASDLCVEADSGGHTDMGVMSVLIPTMTRLRDQFQAEMAYQQPVRVGAAGGIGTPEAAATAFMLGADFIVTGSINQCSVEAGTSDAVKEMLQQINVQDTAYAPAGDMFELGAKVQVMKKSVFFPSRANKLFDVWRSHNGLENLDSKTSRELQNSYFKRSFEDVYNETRAFYLQHLPSEIEKADKNPKTKMALVFRWYFVYTMRLALRGELENRVDFQVHTGPSMGAFNQWVKGSALESWQNRHVDHIAERLVAETHHFMSGQMRSLA